MYPKEEAANFSCAQAGWKAGCGGDDEHGVSSAWERCVCVCDMRTQDGQPLYKANPHRQAGLYKLQAVTPTSMTFCWHAGRCRPRTTLLDRAPCLMRYAKHACSWRDGNELRATDRPRLAQWFDGRQYISILFHSLPIRSLASPFWGGMYEPRSKEEQQVQCQQGAPGRLQAVARHVMNGFWRRSGFESPSCMLEH